MKKLFLASLVALGLSGTAVADDTFTCLSDLQGPVVDVVGTDYVNNDWFWFADGTRFDARGDVFLAQTAPLLPGGSYIDYPIDIRSDLGHACWAGGVVNFTNDLDITWQESKTHNSAAIIGYNTNLTIDGVRIHNSHDGIRPFWTRDDVDVSWEIRNVWVTYNRDDCIENDWFASGLVDDSLFDGCYVFLSSRIGGAIDRGDVVTVQNSLIRLQEMPGPYGHDDPSIMGHELLFKYQAESPGLVLRNNIFLIEDFASTQYDADGSRENSFGALGFRTSQGQLKECYGNVIVWTGPGAFPGDIPNDPACVTVTTDRTVWETAREKWIAEHPLVMRIDGVDAEPVPSPTPEPTPEPVLDTTPPLVDIVSPGNLVQRRSDQIIEVDAYDDTAILRVEIYIDGALWAVLDGAGFVDWKVPGNPHGRYVIEATAIDTSGNFATDTITVFATR